MYVYNSTYYYMQWTQAHTPCNTLIQLMHVYIPINNNALHAYRSTHKYVIFISNIMHLYLPAEVTTMIFSLTACSTTLLK